MARAQETASIFDRIAASTVSQRDPRLAQGNYVLEVVDLQHNKGFKGESFNFRFRVDKATKTGPLDPTPVGTIVANVWNTSTNPYGLGEIKACVAAIAGFDDPNRITGPAITEAVSEKAPCVGALVGCVVGPSDRINEKTGQPYMNCVFQPVKK